jgi:hypothetical protein
MRYFMHKRGQALLTATLTIAVILFLLIIFILLFIIQFPFSITKTKITSLPIENKICDYAIPQYSYEMYNYNKPYITLKNLENHQAAFQVQFALYGGYDSCHDDYEADCGSCTHHNSHDYYSCHDDSCNSCSHYSSYSSRDWEDADHYTSLESYTLSPYEEITINAEDCDYNYNNYAANVQITPLAFNDCKSSIFYSESEKSIKESRLCTLFSRIIGSC